MGRNLQWRFATGDEGTGVWKELTGERALEILSAFVGDEEYEPIGYYDLREKPVEKPAQPMLKYEGDGNVLWA